MRQDPSRDTPALRPPSVVMRLARMGSFHATRLSFMPALLRRMTAERWRFERPVWRIGADGTGCAVYRTRTPERTYSLVAFAHDLPDAMRSDRVIATAWDTTYALHDGEPTEEDIVRLAANVPNQEAGRVSDRELVLSRANRSVRLWAHVVDRLAAGAQPDPKLVESVGYLMRTTAVYGSGKFGAADRAMIRDRPELRAPFRAEMLTVWLIRAFTLDLAEHMARVRGGAEAVPLAPALRRRFGVGNSTGLGMAPFLVSHPVLLNNWIAAREEALARVRTLSEATHETRDAFSAALSAAICNAGEWRSEHPIQLSKLADLRSDLAQIAARVADGPRGAYPWDTLHRWAETNLSVEGQEALIALMLEPHGALIDDLADAMDADEEAAFRIDGRMTAGALHAILRDRYAWAMDTDYDDPRHCGRFWYVSEEKLEPRLGERFAEPGSDLEQPLATGRDIAALAAALGDAPEGEPVAGFLLAHPEHRHAVRRAQIAARYPYAEICENLICAEMLPIDLLRCKLSFFGATKFDPRSDRWVRICMYQDAPFPHEMPGWTG